MEKYLIAKKKMLKTSFWFCFGLFSLSENAASSSKKLPLPSNKRNNHKTTTFYFHTHQTKKEQYYEKIDFKCFDSSDDILVC